MMCYDSTSSITRFNVQMGLDRLLTLALRPTETGPMHTLADHWDWVTNVLQILGLQPLKLCTLERNRFCVGTRGHGNGSVC